MVSKEHKRAEALLHDKLQLLRSVTRSNAIHDTTIVLDASNCIRELKHKVERLKAEIASTEGSPSAHENPWPRVSVHVLKKGGFLVNVSSGKTSPRLLVSVLAVFEELGLQVLDARVSCVHTFHLQAFGQNGEQHGDQDMDGDTVEQAISNAIKNWSEGIE